MSSKDYLTRYFQQLGKVLAALMGLYEKEKYQQVVDEIAEVLDTWFGLPLAEIERKTADELNALVMAMDHNQLEKAKSIAQLLYQLALAQKALNKNIDATDTAQKALVLFKSIDQVSGDYSIEIQQRIAELDTMV